MPLSKEDLLPESSRVVQPSYLEKHKHKNDLLRRFRNLLKVLRNEETIVVCDSPEWPGLAATAHKVLEWSKHSDKEIRLYATLTALEILSIYAPDMPYDDDQIMALFQSVNQQMANLANMTTDMPDWPQYFRMLELLAKVRMGCVLIELFKQQSQPETLILAAEFFHTLLHSVRVHHTSQVLEFCQQAITACLEDDGQGNDHLIPVPLLDEVLLCIGQGHKVWVPNPAAHLRNNDKKDKKGKNATKEPLQIEQTNPSYMVAAAVVRAIPNKIATPVALLLTNILNHEPHVMEQSGISIDDVYKIIYELHRVAPQILTTVIGTVSNDLRVPEIETRRNSTELLGKLFASGMATQYHSCFREWLSRQSDVSVEIRQLIVQYGVLILQKPGYVADETIQTLIHLVTSDPSVEVRLDVIYKVSDFLYRAKPHPPPAALLRAIGNRISSKHKEERKNALTGLAQIYFRNFVSVKLKNVQAGGDDCALAVVLEALHDTCHLEERQAGDKSKRRRKSNVEDFRDVDEEAFAWIPRKVFESVCFTDQIDTDMRSRVVQIVDDILLGSELSSSGAKKLTSTARAIGLTMILDSLRLDGESLLIEGSRSNAYKFLLQLFGQRSALQKATSKYLYAREAARNFVNGSEEALVADAKAREHLEVVASLCAPVSGSSLETVLTAFHSARDKHIFRILSLVLDPLHTPDSRKKALDDLPKRTKSLGDAVSVWVTNLVKRCCMGDFFNADVICHCVLLAQECFNEGDIPACAALLAPVKTAAGVFPTLCSPLKTFSSLTELFSECRQLPSGDLKSEVDGSGILTTISSLLSTAVPKSVSPETNALEDVAGDALQNELMQLCTRDGTPEQARNAVYALARMLAPEDVPISGASVAPISEKSEAFLPLVKSLTSPSRLAVSDSDKSSRIITTLSALAALADCQPAVFLSTERGQKALKFALDNILMGRGRSKARVDDSGSESGSDDGGTGVPTPTARTGNAASPKKRSKNATPEATARWLEDENLSIACRRVCAAIDFLCCAIRSSILVDPKKESCLPSDLISQVFQLLTQMLRDKGLPPSSSDRRACKPRQDRAVIRQCCAIGLMRLSDSRLGLEGKLLSPAMWHVLGDAFLDEEKSVRESVMEELCNLLRGVGVYGLEGSRSAPQPPALRFIAFVCLCSDGDHGLENDAANGNAANVGKRTGQVKSAAQYCVVNVRRISDQLYAQCQASGKNGDQKYETLFKTRFMPEYMTPYALHLLSHRRETPCAEGKPGDDVQDEAENSSPASVDEESQHRVLSRRLRMFLEPLVSSLGDGADNISFLLRLVEIVGKHYRPVDVASTMVSSALRISIGSDSSMDTKPREDDSERVLLLEARSKTICSAAREVLLSFVKKDVNLTSYPGTIKLPSNLFRRTPASLRMMAKKATTSVRSGSRCQGGKEIVTSTTPIPASTTKTSVENVAHSSIKKRAASRTAIGGPVASMEKKSRVHFSPEVQTRSGSTAVDPPSENKDDFGGVSPIVKSGSPSSAKRASPRLRRSARSSRSEETFGSTPPSILLGATMHSEPEGFNDMPSQESSLGLGSPLVLPTKITGSKKRTALADAESSSLPSATQTSRESESTKHKPRARSSQEQSKESDDSAKEVVKPKPTRRGAKGSQVALKQSVPSQIQVKRPSVSSSRGSKRVKTSEFDFPDDSGSENEPSRNVGRARNGDTTKFADKDGTAGNRKKGRARH